MDVQPVKYVASPTYPSRREFLTKGSLFLLAAGIGGCNRASAHPVVAPVFAHGEGRAYMGCVAINAPVFLSEEEALQILKEEFSKEGIALGAGMPLAGVNVEFKDDTSTNHWLGEEKETRVIPGSLDAVDRNRRVGIQYVSREDNEKAEIFWGSYDTPKVAERFAEEFQSQGKDDLVIGIFYDPITDMHMDFFNAIGKNIQTETNDTEKEQKNVREREVDGIWEKCKRAALVKSKEMLRRQARDFVAWLQQQKTA
jgi:hypothetical protein